MPSVEKTTIINRTNSAAKAWDIAKSIWSVADLPATTEERQKIYARHVMLNGLSGVQTFDDETTERMAQKAVEDELAKLALIPTTDTKNLSKNKSARIKAAQAARETAHGGNLTSDNIKVITNYICTNQPLHVGSSITARLRALQYVVAKRTYVKSRCEGINHEKAWVQTQKAVKSEIVSKTDFDASGKGTKSVARSGGCPPEWAFHAESWLSLKNKHLAADAARKLKTKDSIKETREVTDLEFCQKDDYQLAPIHCAGLLGKLGENYPKPDWLGEALKTVAGTNYINARGVARLKRVDHTPLTFYDFSDAPGFINKIQQAADPLSKHIFSHLQPATIADLPRVLKGHSSTVALIKDLNVELRVLRKKLDPTLALHFNHRPIDDVFEAVYRDFVDFNENGEKKVTAVYAPMLAYDWRGILPEYFATVATKSAIPILPGIPHGIKAALEEILLIDSDIVADQGDGSIPPRAVKALCNYYLPFLALQTSRAINGFERRSNVPLRKNGNLIERGDIFSEVAKTFCEKIYEYDPFRCPNPKEPKSSKATGNSIVRWAFHPTLHVLTDMLVASGLYTRNENKRKRALTSARDDFEAKYGRSPNESELNKMGWTQSQLLKADSIMQRMRVYITEEVADNLADKVLTPDEVLGRRDEDSEFIRIWLKANLPLPERQVILLLAIDNLGESEISVGMNCTAPYVIKLKNRALDRLGAVMQDVLLNYTATQIKVPSDVLRRLQEPAKKDKKAEFVVRHWPACAAMAGAIVNGNQNEVAALLNSFLSVHVQVDAKQAESMDFSLELQHQIRQLDRAIKKQNQVSVKELSAEDHNPQIALSASETALAAKKLNRMLLDETFGALVKKYNDPSGFWSDDPKRTLRKTFEIKS